MKASISVDLGDGLPVLFTEFIMLLSMDVVLFQSKCLVDNGSEHPLLFWGSRERKLPVLTRKVGLELPDFNWKYVSGRGDRI